MAQRNCKWNVRWGIYAMHRISSTQELGSIFGQVEKRLWIQRDYNSLKWIFNNILNFSNQVRERLHSIKRSERKISFKRQLPLPSSILVDYLHSPFYPIFSFEHWGLKAFDSNGQSRENDYMVHFFKIRWHFNSFSILRVPRNHFHWNKFTKMSPKCSSSDVFKIPIKRRITQLF